MAVNPTSHALIPSVSQRFSPYQFEPRAVEMEKLNACFEAASWAASSFNEQPWRWIVASRENESEFQKMLGCLMEANQGWASKAGALVLTAFRSKFSRNDRPNRVALHDLGQASAHFALQATQLGLQVHQMAGINLSQIRAEYGIEPDFEPATAIAIGYPLQDQNNPNYDAELAGREQSARNRRPLSESVYQRHWGNAALQD